jgi:hypothetical protein
MEDERPRDFERDEDFEDFEDCTRGAKAPFVLAVAEMVRVLREPNQLGTPEGRTDLSDSFRSVSYPLCLPLARGGDAAS